MAENNSTQQGDEKLDAPLGLYAPWAFSPEQTFKSDDLEDTQIGALRDLVQKASQRDMASRRFEVTQAWQARLFDRGYQHLLRRPSGGWMLPQEKKGNENKSFDNLETNIYSPTGQILISALTRDTPKIKFEPEDPENDKDITAANAAEEFKKVFARNNDLILLQTEEARYLYNDGRAHILVDYVLDAQRFGFEEEQDEQAVVPEDEVEGGTVSPVSQADGSAGPEAEGGQAPQPTGLDSVQGEPEGLSDSNRDDSSSSSSTNEGKTPKGREVAICAGKLETKVPMNTKEQCEWHFLNYSKEHDQSQVKAMFPWIADKIAPGGGPGENELDRIARINCALALNASYVTGDAMVNDVTVSKTWLRPAAFMDCPNTDGMRDTLMQMFPDGALVVFAGKEFAFARNESMDDHWSLAKANPSDGMNSAPLGAWMIPIQKRVNNWVDLLDLYFVKGVKRTYMDNQSFNIAAIQSLPTSPAMVVPFTRQPGVPFQELMGEDPDIEAPEAMSSAIDKFCGELSQLLSGAYPALSGGDTEGNDTATGINTQRDQALGRLGPAWHAIQAAHASMNRQAVMCAARCRQNNVKQSVGEANSVMVELDDLKGNVLCYPEADSQFPESQGERNARLNTFMDAAAKNPIVQKMALLPKNLKLIKDGTGFADFDLPDTDSVDKQLGELEILLKTGPIPNPQLQQIGEKVASMLQGAQARGEQIPPQAKQQMQQAIAQIPKLVSTVPIDEQFDNHQVEYDTLAEWINSPDGRKTKNGTPEEKESFENVKLHAMEHFAIIQKQQAAAAQSQSKSKVSESINFADLPPDGQVQMAGQAGIKIQPPPPEPAPSGPVQ